MKKDLTVFDGVALYHVSLGEMVEYFVPGTVGFIKKELKIPAYIELALLNKDYRCELTNSRETADIILKMNDIEYKAFLKGLYFLAIKKLNRSLLLI